MLSLPMIPQAKPFPALVHKWYCTRSLDGNPAPPSLTMLELGQNMRFRSVRDEQVDRLHYVIWEGFGKYTVSAGTIKLDYSSMSKTWCHEQLGPSFSFLKVPPRRRTIPFSSMGANELVLKLGSHSFVYTPNDWDRIKFVNGEADGIWWNKHVFEDLAKESSQQSRRHVDRTSRR
jgi:hypothetical protein